MDSTYAGQFFEWNNLAIGGYDPVAYFTEQKPTKGSAQFRAEFEGSAFQFASAVHRDIFAWLLTIFGGRQAARTIHFVACFSFIGFILIHVVHVILTGFFNNIRSMVTG